MASSNLRNALNIGTSFLFLFFRCCVAAADDTSFMNSLARADVAQKNGDIDGAIKIYTEDEQAQGGNATNMCVLSRRYCDLTYSTDSTTTQKVLVVHALRCAQHAVDDNPKNATAHASLAVCYAKSCNYSDTKTKLAYSKIFKSEAEKALALDPRQDVAYYLLGRWNYGMAKVGFFSRAYVKMVYGGLPEASFQESVNNFKKACDLAPNHILNHAGLAMAYEAVGEKTLEIAELEKCCALKPLSPEDKEAYQDAQKKLSALR
jgi:tetratricopeptide (TPR) repeat protein